ncbi:iron complex transport system substrate-binding protein [Sphingomonas vulcanisoli]|uniref:Iron complex transport system substrate-binding protein n=1 Tax=Sphingomonas vulcanisoli TaxID=1658060 RepID=A0ABX0TT07_9SPHN|nr:ABC transporter substrate-binding protein [Sphingomonas vulcanisoli]NIJ08586.1 iron complex transport system substrate-binding protein [Sphingomonas vulcanisoli]
MRRSISFALGVALSLLGDAALSAIPAHPMRVMSLNQCTDQIVLALLPPDRIASVTWLSRDPQGSLMAAVAARVAVNHGMAEEVVRQRPDLIVTSSLASPATRGLLQRMGWPMIAVDDASSFDQIRSVTRQIAAAVDERARGEVLIAAMDRKLADLARHPAPPIRVAAWDGGGFSAQKGSLYDAVLRTAGAINVANEPPANGYGRPDTEVLLETAPQLLIQGGYDQAGLRANIAHHPLVRHYWGKDRTLVIRQAYYLCGTPFIADAALMLRRELGAAAGAARSPLPFAAGAGR